MPDEKKTKKEKKEKTETKPKDDAEDDDRDVAAPTEETVDFGKKKKDKKDKKAKDDDEEKDGTTAADDATALFGEKKKKKPKEKKPTPVVCQVLEVAPVPKKDKLRLCKVCVAEGSDPVSIVTNAVNVVVGGRFICALPGVTTASGVEVKEAKIGGIESFGMFCGPNEMGWDTDVLDEKLAVQVSDDAEPGAPAPGYEAAVQAFKEREKAAEEAKVKEEQAGGKGKKKKEKKKAKQGGAAGDDDDEFEAALAEVKAEEAKEEPKEEAKADAPKEVIKEEEKEAGDAEVDAKTLANRKKKEKKKAKQGGAAGDDDDEFEAALAEVKAEEAKEEPKEEEAKADAPKEAIKEEEENEAGDAEDAKTLANRKKKEKKKAKASAVGGEGLWGAEDGAEPSGGVEATDAPKDEEAAPKAAPKKGAKVAAPKKESAIVKAARERLEAEAKLEAEKKAFEEAERARIAEEERIAREEEEALERERERKRKLRADKIARQKEEGTYLTKSAKQRELRAKQLREQFGFNLDDKGDSEEEKPAASAKRPMATKMKKKKPTAKDEGSEAAEGVEVTEKFEPPPRSQEAKEENEKEQKKEEMGGEEDDEDGWEKAAEKEEDEEKEEEEKEGGNGSDSDSDSESASSSGSSDSSGSSVGGLRSPIIVIMGHVDTGKTKLLDKIRRTNVQEGEAGGITQQIGATFFPDIALQEQTSKVDPDFELEVPGVMVIDTPGHESFNNLRARGSSLCDLAILVIDIMHGLEPQTVESLEMLKKRKCLFVIALNKIDACYQWNSDSYTPVREALARQEQFVRDEFQQRYDKVALQLNERGLNVALYWENDDMRRNINIVPTSALTGEGVPDLLYMLINLSQKLMPSKLEVKEELQCTVIEVKIIEGLGTTIDVILVNGTLREGDQIVLAGMSGPIVTTIRALLTPQPMKEMRVKSEYVHHAKIDQSMGVKICAPGLEEAVAGTELVVVGPEDDIEELKEAVDDEFDSILNNFEKQAEGVYVKASTLGSLEALLSFLADMKIPVFDVGIGEVFKKDVKKAMIMKEKKHPEYALILCFDVKVNNEAKQQAATDGVQIFTADIIYHLFDKFKTYMEKVQESKKTETRQEVVFPVLLDIDRNHIFHKIDPIVFACTVLGGQLRLGTPICVPEKDNLEIGRVGGIEKNKKAIPVARKGEQVCVKIEQNTAQNHILYGRHFDATNRLVSKITRSSIDTLKEHFKDEMNNEDWEVVVGLKKVLGIT